MENLHLRAIAIALVYLPELEGKPLLLKIPQILRTRLGEIELELAWILLPEDWLS